MPDSDTIVLSLNENEAAITYVALKKWRIAFPEDVDVVNKLLTRIYDQSPALQEEYLAPEETYSVK